MDLNLEGRSVLIRGESRGIGECVANVMAEEGCRITITASDAEKLKQVADGITVPVTAHAV
jgi:3-oxoacyl-[acyl-carrier protein] reductase